MKKKLILFFLAMVSWGAYAQHDHASHYQNDGNSAARFENDALNMAYSHYLQIKDALVSSDLDVAKKEAMELQNALEDVKNSSGAMEAASNLVGADGLDQQRKAFSTLSAEMTRLVKAGKLLQGTLYLEYCPMADAFWLSNDKEIANPYFGDKMLRCGSVKETIQ